MGSPSYRNPKKGIAIVLGFVCLRCGGASNVQILYGDDLGFLSRPGVSLVRSGVKICKWGVFLYRAVGLNELEALVMTARLICSAKTCLMRAEGDGVQGWGLDRHHLA